MNNTEKEAIEAIEVPVGIAIKHIIQTIKCILVCSQNGSNLDFDDTLLLIEQRKKEIHFSSGSELDLKINTIIIGLIGESSSLLIALIGEIHKGASISSEDLVTQALGSCKSGIKEIACISAYSAIDCKDEKDKLLAVSSAQRVAAQQLLTSGFGVASEIKSTINSYIEENAPQEPYYIDLDDKSKVLVSKDILELSEIAKLYLELSLCQNGFIELLLSSKISTTEGLYESIYAGDIYAADLLLSKAEALPSGKRDLLALFVSVTVLGEKERAEEVFKEIKRLNEKWAPKRDFHEEKYHFLTENLKRVACGLEKIPALCLSREEGAMVILSAGDLALNFGLNLEQGFLYHWAGNDKPIDPDIKDLLDLLLTIEQGATRDLLALFVSVKMNDESSRLISTGNKKCSMSVLSGVALLRDGGSNSEK